MCKIYISDLGIDIILYRSNFEKKKKNCRAMNLSVPCIVEGRSELRNVGRVNCKTQGSFRAAEHLSY
jgi:hypothetical protein